MLKVSAFLLWIGFACKLWCQTPAPVLFYSDLDSGPAVPANGGTGAMVCVYGENFGPAGTLTIGGATATNILWSDPGAPYSPGHYAKACGRIAATANPGAGVIQLTTAAGAGSNTVPFTVRSGNVYYVSATGDDSSGDGSYGNPWLTITNCKNRFAPGDICVAGTSATDVMTFTLPEAASWGTVVGLLLNSCGAPGYPKAIVAYPGNSVTYDLHAYYDSVDLPSLGGGRAIQDYNTTSSVTNCGLGNPISDWTIAGLSFDSNSFSSLASLRTRFVDNQVKCTGEFCDGSAAGLSGGEAGNLTLYGNRFHDIGCGLGAPCATAQAHPSKLFQNVYLGKGSHLTVAYNEINGNGGACRGLQLYSDSGQPEQDIQIYNNAIHNTVCDGINLATVDPSGAGGVNVYNNLVYNAGIGNLGENPPDGISHYSCFYSAAASCSQGASGTIQVFNNTFYNCGAVGLLDAGAIAANRCPALTVGLTNNLIVQPISVLPYQTAGSASIAATSNDCFGYTSAGAYGCPSAWGGTWWSVDPLFAMASTANFHLSSNSPAVGMSISAPLPATDADGLLRVTPASPGAYELNASPAINNPSGQAPVLLLSCPELSYDGTAHSCTASAKGAGGATVSGSWSLTPASVITAGSYAVTGIFTSSDPLYSGGIIRATQIIDRIAPTVTFTGAPSSAAYHAKFAVAASTNAGTAVTITASGSCTVAGSIVTMTKATGNCTLTASWAATANYQAATTTQQTAAEAGAPVIVWPPPAAITYGSALGPLQLNARATYQGATVAGTFTYTPAKGTVLSTGQHTLSVTFTPTQSAFFSSASGSTPVLVNPATPKISWRRPAAIVYGAGLSATQLNATALVPGTFAYSPAAGSVLTGGTHTLSVTFTPNDATEYTPATASNPIVILKAVPVVSWTAPAPITYGSAVSSTQLNATASVPGTFRYSPGTGTVPAGGQQKLSVTFSPSDMADYTTQSASVPLQVNPATPTITWPTPLPIKHGRALSAVQLNAQATLNATRVAGTFVYTPAVGTVLAAGQNTLSVVFIPANAANLNSASATVTLVVY